MKSLIVQENNLKSNIKIIKQLINKNNEKNVKIIAVVKGNGYGLGLINYTKFLIDNGIDFFAVSTIEEAIKLRKSGISKKILMLSSTSVESEIIELIENNIILTVGTEEAGNKIQEIAKEKNTQVKVHLKIDTGFGRHGFLYTEPEKIVENVKKWTNIKIEGTFSHFSLSFYKKEKYTKLQYARFIECVKKIQESKIPTGMLHICNSSATIKYPEMHLNAVRVGSALTGRSVIKKNSIELKRVGYLITNVYEIKYLPKGYNIGYSNSYKTKRNTQIAIIQCGYADGYNVIQGKDMFRLVDKLRYIVREVKNFFKKNYLYVTINEQKCRVIGRVGMYHSIIDITEKNVKIGDIVKIDVNPIFINSDIERIFK